MFHICCMGSDPRYGAGALTLLPQAILVVGVPQVQNLTIFICTLHLLPNLYHSLLDLLIEWLLRGELPPSANRVHLRRRRLILCHMAGIIINITERTCRLSRWE